MTVLCEDVHHLTHCVTIRSANAVKSATVKQSQQAVVMPTCPVCRCEEEREYLKKQQGEVEHKLEVVCKTEADAKAEAKHAQLRYQDREHELNERADLLRRQETELVRQQRVEGLQAVA